MALLHYSSTPLTIIDNKSCIKGKEQTIRFLKCDFGSVKEAKRRTLILALLTYRLTKEVFVPFYTDKMMENPLILMNLRELWTVFKTHNWKEGGNHLEKKTERDEKDQPLHAGLIISSEDQYLATAHPYIKIRVKTQKGNYGEPDEIIEVERDIIITSTKQEVNQLKQEAIEKEKAMEEARNLKVSEVKNKIKEIGKKKEPAAIHIVKSGNSGIEKVNLSDISSRMNRGRETATVSPLRTASDMAHSERSLSKYNLKRQSGIFPNVYNDEYFKHTTANERARDMHMYKAEVEEQKRQEILKIREINKLMKSLGKEEHENNIRLFQKYNEDEKQIISALIKKTKEKDLNEKITKRLHVIKASRRKEVLNSNKNFALNFSRQKNLIEKYEQAGEKSKRMRNERFEKLSKVKTLRAFKSHKTKVQLSTQVFDTSFVEDKPMKERKWNLFLQIYLTMYYRIVTELPNDYGYI